MGSGPSQRSSTNPFNPNRVARIQAHMRLAVIALPSAAFLPWQAMSALLDEIAPVQAEEIEEERSKEEKSKEEKSKEETGDEAPIDFGVAVASDWLSLTWSVVGERDQLLGRLGAHSRRAGVPAAALFPLLRLSAALGLSTVGCWWRGETTGLAAGWFLPDPLPLARITNLLPSHQSGSRLLQWTQRSGIEFCERFTQAYLGAPIQTALQLPLPGDSLMSQFAHALRLFEALGVEGVSDAMLTAITALAPAAAKLRIVVELSDAGLTQIGIAVPAPPLRLILQLHEVATGLGDGQNEQLAAFQGTLGAADMESIYCLQSAQGPRLLYNYYPLGDES